MKTKMLGLIMTFLPLSNASIDAARIPVSLQATAVDPTTNQGGHPRGPISVPLLCIDDYELSFSTQCYGYTLELVDMDGKVLYTTIITSNTMALPNTLSGTYELRLIPDGNSIYFYGFITL